MTETAVQLAPASAERDADERTRHRGRQTVTAALLVVFVVTLFVHAVMHFDHFDMPRGDFMSWGTAAEELARGSLRREGVRLLPLYPGLMALGHTIYPSAHTIRYTGEVISLVAAIGIAFALFAVGSRLLGNAALLVVWLFCLNPELVAVGLQPMSDALFALLVIAAFAVDARGSAWCYAAALLAALVRYEGVFVVFALWVRDVLFGPSRLQRTVFAAAAILPMVVWEIVVAQATSGARASAARAVITHGWAGIHFLKAFLAGALEFLPRAFAEAVKQGTATAIGFGLAVGAVITACAVVGAVRTFRQQPRLAAALSIFFVCFTALHCYVPAAVSRYAIPILWILYLCMLVGVASFVLERQGSRSGSVGVAVLLGATLLALAVCHAVWPVRKAALIPGVLFAIPIVVYLVQAHRRQVLGAIPTAMACVIVFLVALGTSDYQRYKLDRDAGFYAELIPVAEWCKSIQGDDWQLVCDVWTSDILEGFLAVPRQNLLPGKELPSPDPNQDILRTPRTYILWNSTDFRKSIDPAETRQRLEDPGWQLIAAIHEGRGPWRRAVTFRRRGSVAEIYERVDSAPDADPAHEGTGLADENSAPRSHRQLR